MKSKLTMKLLGIVVTIATLASLLVGITVSPVSAAAGTLAYGIINAPSKVGSVLTAKTQIDLMAVSADGMVIFALDAYASNSDSDPATADGSSKIYKSTDGGVTFDGGKFVDPDPLSAYGDVVGIAISPKYATDNTIVVAKEFGVFRSTNGGSSWSAVAQSQLDTVIGFAEITSVDLGYYYAGNTLSIVIGLADGDTGNSKHVLKFATGATDWKALGHMYNDVVGVKINPYLSDYEVVCVYTVSTIDGEMTYLSSIIGTFDWDDDVCQDITIKTGTTATHAAVIAFPSNYKAGQGYMVGLRDGDGTGGLYLISGRGGRTSPDGTAKKKYLPDPADGTADIWSIAVTDSLANVYFGSAWLDEAQVWASTAITASDPKFGTAIKPPTGQSGDTETSVAVAGSKVFAGTNGYGCALSVSTDAGATFNQTALIYTYNIANCYLYELKVIDNNTMFLVMANDSPGRWSYLFKTTDGGATWQRIATEQGDEMLLAVSPAYATDKSLVYTVDGDPMTALSTDGGQTFGDARIPGVVNVTAIYLGASGAIYAGGDDGGAPAKCVFYKSGRWDGATDLGDGTDVYSIAIKDTAATAETTIAVGLMNGKVKESTDNGASFTERKSAATALSYGVSDEYVTVAYGPDGSLYAGGDEGTDFARYNGTDWKYAGATSQDENPGGTPTYTEPEEIYNMVVAKDGTLYASDYADGHGIWRSLAPATDTPEYQPLDQYNFPSLMDCVPADANTNEGELFALQVVNEATANTLYVINDNYASAKYGYTSRIMAFKDTLIVPVVLATPANAAQVDGTDKATLTWTALTGAKYYSVLVNPKADFSGAGWVNVGNVSDTTIDTVNILGAGVLNQGTAYYWKVRVVSTSKTNALYSKWATSRSFTTALQQPEVKTVQFPTNGATNVPVETTFTWPGSTAGGATYEFVIAQELGNVDKFAIIDYSATCPTNATVLRETLKYDTTYWWRVRTVTGTSKSAWTTSFFTTGPAPVTTTPTTAVPPVTITTTNFTVTNPTPTTFTITQPTATPPASPIPSYLLWAVIAVGAILVIAVIVLIVRTRKI